MLSNIFALLALLGFLASLTVHIAAICGYPAHEMFPAIWGLHMGVFVVFLPAVIRAKRSGFNNKDFWKHLPRPQALICQFMFVYTIFNFFYGMTTIQSGSWDASTDGSTYTFTPKGGKKQTVTRETYMKQNATIDRMFSGHWMLFYLVAFTLLSASPVVPKRMFASR